MISYGGKGFFDKLDAAVVFPELLKFRQQRKNQNGEKVINDYFIRENARSTE